MPFKTVKAEGEFGAVPFSPHACLLPLPLWNSPFARTWHLWGHPLHGEAYASSLFFARKIKIKPCPLSPATWIPALSGTQCICSGGSLSSSLLCLLHGAERWKMKKSLVTKQRCSRGSQDSDYLFPHKETAGEKVSLVDFWGVSALG